MLLLNFAALDDDVSQVGASDAFRRPRRTEGSDAGAQNIHERTELHAAARVGGCSDRRVLAADGMEDASWVASRYES